ncbi:MAG: hypothetical protein HKN19_02230 [Halioglobus sp.]|nr:hypothetical protein [Halioglobus sp.]
MDYLSVEEAIKRPGLRLVLTAGVPGPWGEAAKYILDYKKVAYAPVYQEGGGENLALKQWTGQTSAPVLVDNDLPPVCHWLDLLLTAERIAPRPALLPANAAERTAALGLCALIAGMDGFGWNRRLQMFAPLMALDEPPPPIARMMGKYGWSDEAHATAGEKLNGILAELDRVLLAQAAAGSEYFVGASVTAVDLYWASFSGMLKPLPPAQNRMPDFLRSTYETVDDSLAAAFTPSLEAHRDRIFERYITLPLDF